MAEKITYDQACVIGDLVSGVAYALGLSEDEAHEIIKAGGALQQQVKPILQKLAMVDQRFGPAVKDFEFTVPADYVHDTQLDTFAEKTKKLPTTYYFDDNITSKNFAKATNKLEPGKTYRVRIFPVLERVTTEHCMSFLAKQNAILVGGQGITLLQAEKADTFPFEKWTISLDQKESLWEGPGGSHNVLFVGRDSDGGWRFGIMGIEGSWRDDCSLLCITDK